MLRLLTATLLAALLCPFAAHAAPRAIEVPADGGGVFLRVPTYVDARVLAANTAESFTVPTSAKYVVFSPTCGFYANYTTTAAVPSGDVTDGSASEYNPTQRFVLGVTSISVISASTCVITAAFYR